MGDENVHKVGAYGFQGSEDGRFRGSDYWKDDTLKLGDKLVQLDYSRSDSATSTASNFFTTYEELQQHIDPETGKVNTASLSERLQVSAFRPEGATEFNYAPKVTIYEVVEEMPVATAKVTDNPVFGQGGADQVFSNDPQGKLIYDANQGTGYLKPVGEIEALDTSTRLPIYSELKGVPDEDVVSVIERNHDAYRDALVLSGDDKALEVRQAMDKRQAFSETARDIQGNPEAIRTAELPNVNATTLDLDSETLRKVDTIRDESLGRVPDSTRTPVSDADINRSSARISDADAAGELRSFAATPDGNTSYLIDTKTSTIYTVTGDDLTGVQKFDSSQEAGHAFGRMMSEAAQTYPDSFKGLPQVHNSLSSLGSHIDDLGRPAWRKALGAFGEGAAEFGGKASKILGPLGVAAAGAEVYGLESKLRDYEEFGLVPEEAMLAYRANLTAHTAQATVDPSLVGGEVVVQAAHDQWAKAYGISEEVKEALEPGSLLEDVYDATQWLEAQASAAGMAVKDYAVDRFHNPEKIGEDLERIGDAAINFGSDVLETTGQAVDAVGNYADARLGDPSLFVDDAQAVGGAIKDGVMGVWGSLFGKDEPSSLERTLENAGATPPFIPYSQGVEQFVNDRETLNTQDPQAQWVETRAANHPSAEAMLVRLHDAGIERLPSDIIAGETARERVSDVLTVTHDIDKSLNLQADNNRDQGQGQEQLQSEGTQDQNVTHAYTQEEYDYAYD